MAEHDGKEKTEQPTGKKLSDARDRGQVAKSREVNSLAVFSTGFIVLYLFQGFIGGRIKTFTVSIFDSLDTFPNRLAMISTFMTDWYIFFAITLAPVVVGLIVVIFAANISQVGIKLSPKALSIKFDKLNVVNGVKNLISAKSFFELIKSIVKLIITGGFLYYVLEDLISSATQLESFSINEILIFMLDAAFDLIWKIGLVYLLIAAADFAWEKYKFRKSMMMTKEEVKEEWKQTEGDPQVKSRIKKLMYEASKRRMMKDLPTADVVITNPTHYAVALKYDMTKDAAPAVIAKGVDELAQKIKEVAKKHDIPIQENKELARALYKMCDIGERIPSSLFKAVAEVLAYVYNLKKSKKKSIV
ncbi:MAG: flagellar biosynthesis protein FlhB [Ignavibacterium sp.]|mgnify:FL=1|jgi:flagellar biosynthetic protein FlhB|nr:MAG: flagellar biosynthesis protein FlhB [Ignavibacterium sp.]MDD5607303.1 flagellar biosynthesis protein FlhB [Ignavibacterium sp.]MDX9711424.1 flagellar biosynthesis protein FlhB [Ignavibacteriaceae bacterium]MEB2354291.1 flagellar biosynthesis protein FlhB [Ignavibacteriales bacterium]GIK22514.1 MAG: flagellar biosynthesis protein FlhB [Ignavibacteriota bacterium]